MLRLPFYCHRAVQLRFKQSRKSFQTKNLARAAVYALGGTLLTTGTANYIRTDVPQIEKAFRDTSHLSPVPGLTIVGMLWGGITAGCLIASSSLTARYALRAGSQLASHPITWLTSAALHGSLLHLAANSICGYSFARDMRTVDAIEMFILGCLWCGCLTTFWGLARPIIAVGCGTTDLARPIMAVGSSGGICGLFGYSIYQNWDNHRPQMGLLLISDIIRWMDRTFGLSIPYSFTFRQTFYIFTSVSILLAFRQLQTGRGFISHVGHLGGLFGGMMGAYDRALNLKRRR